MKPTRISALIVDDEALARKFIRRMMKDDDEVEIVGECADGKEALATIEKRNPDLVFLDVQMPEMDGLSVLRSLGQARLPQIVFTTAYEQYTIRAFELHALDYLLKPFDQTRFRDALARAKEQVRYRQQEDSRLRIGALLETLERPPEYLERLIIKAQGCITFLRTREIDWIEADDKYVHLHAGARAPLVRQTLSAMESQLDPKRFVRIHRSAIVNVERIKELQPLFNGEYSVLLESGIKLTVTKSYKDQLFAVLGKPL